MDRSGRDKGDARRCLVNQFSNCLLSLPYPMSTDGVKRKTTGKAGPKKWVLSGNDTNEGSAGRKSQGITNETGRQPSIEY